MSCIFTVKWVGRVAELCYKHIFKVCTLVSLLPRARGRFLKTPLALNSVLSHFWPDGAWGGGEVMGGSAVRCPNIEYSTGTGGGASGRNQNKGKSASNLKHTKRPAFSQTKGLKLDGHRICSGENSAGS